MPATSEAAPAATSARGVDWDAVADLAATQGHVGHSAVAALLELDRTTYWRYRNGMVPNLDVVDEIATHLGVPTASILRQADTSRPPSGPTTDTPPSGPKAA